MDIQELSEKIKDKSVFCANLLREVEGTVIGQKPMVESILTGILDTPKDYDNSTWIPNKFFKEKGIAKCGISRPK